MRQYKIKPAKNLRSNPICEIEGEDTNLFDSYPIRQTLPRLLQFYYDFLSLSYTECSTEFIVSDIENTRLNIKLCDEQTLSFEKISLFFEHWNNFIEHEKTENNREISIVIEGDDRTLQAFKEYKKGKTKGLQKSKAIIDKKIEQEMKPTVLKWSGGSSALFGALGFAVGGPIGALGSAGLGFAIGAFLGNKATPHLSLATESHIKDYENRELLKDFLTVIPLRGSIAQAALAQPEQKLPLSVEAEKVQEHSLSSIKSFF